ncbi:MAG: hypothetical protein ACKVI4_18185, partial [Actinomycetales bacterium]
VGDPDPTFGEWAIDPRGPWQTMAWQTPTGGVPPQGSSQCAELMEGCPEAMIDGTVPTAITEALTLYAGVGKGLAARAAAAAVVVARTTAVAHGIKVRGAAVAAFLAQLGACGVQAARAGA